MKILKTKDYDKFKSHLKNRRIDFGKVSKLQSAIEQNNLLHLFPIIVDPEYFILDGQHRFEAAKHAGEELYYVISENGYGIQHVAQSNSFQSHWKLDDYILYYSASGLEPYKKLQHLSLKTMIGSGVLIALGSNSKTDDVKEGMFEFSNYDALVELTDYAKEFQKQFGFSHWRRRSFLKALKYALKVKHFNKEKLLTQVAENPKLLVRCAEVDDYIAILEMIYNKGSKEPVRFL